MPPLHPLSRRSYLAAAAAAALCALLSTNSPRTSDGPQHLFHLLSSGPLLVEAGPSHDQYYWNDDRLVSMNLDTVWDDRNIVPIQCVKMDGEEYVVYTLYENDHTVEEVAVAPTYDDDANAANNNGNGDDRYNGNGDDQYNQYNQYNNNDDAAAGDDAYNNGDDAYNANGNGNGNNNNYANGDDAYNAGDDYAGDDVYVQYADDAAGDDGGYNNNNNNNDDDGNGGNGGGNNGDDDAYNGDDAAGDDGYNNNNGDDDGNNNDDGNGRRLLVDFDVDLDGSGSSIRSSTSTSTTTSSGNNQIDERILSSSSNAKCQKRKGTYYAPLPDFLRAYTRQKDVNALYRGYDNTVPAAIKYLSCTKYNPNWNDNDRALRRSLYGGGDGGDDGEEELEEELEWMEGELSRRSLHNNNNNNSNHNNHNRELDQNDDNNPYNYYNKDLYLKVSCYPSTGKALELHAYKDDKCTKRLRKDEDANAIISNLGLSYLKVRWNHCQNCVVWPDDDRDGYADDDRSHHSNEFQADDDYFWNNHQYDSPLCTTAWSKRHGCGPKCRVTMAERYNGYGHHTRTMTTTGKVVAVLMAVAIAGFLFFIHRERQSVSTEKDVLRKVGGRYITMPVLCGVAGGFLLLAFLFELLEMKKVSWSILVPLTTLFGLYWYSLYRARTGKKGGLLDGTLWYDNGGVMT